MKMWRGLATVALLVALAGDVDGRQRQWTDGDADRDLARLSARAESPEQHSRVADLLRDRATQLEAQARRAERTARSLEQRRYPHQHKLPAIAQPGYKERTAAREARAQARAHRARAARHAEAAAPAHVEPES